MAYRLAHDIDFVFRDLHKVHARKATPVNQAATGGFYIEPRHAITKSDTQPGSIWAHDTTYYYLWVDDSAVEEIKNPCTMCGNELGREPRNDADVCDDCWEYVVLRVGLPVDAP